MRHRSWRVATLVPVPFVLGGILRQHFGQEAIDRNATHQKSLAKTTRKGGL